MYMSNSRFRDNACFASLFYDWSLEAVDCHIHSIRYDIVLESSAGGPSHSKTPHQATYDV